jgi:adenosylcobinamide kinase/adenosylcobinamide-phosphate guanylyltransferase
MARQTIFILGGARSGKSRYAVTLAPRLGERVLFVATAQARDEEMMARIVGHRAERPRAWRTLEVPIALGAALQAPGNTADVIIIDCLTLWVSNILGGGVTEPGADGARSSAALKQEIISLRCAIKENTATFIIVSNEVGSGLVPETPLGRLYRDLLGQTNQEMARLCDRVYFMVSGIPWPVKGGEITL